MKMKKYQNGNERPGAGENNSKPIEEGDTVEIIGGNFAGMRGILIDIDDEIGMATIDAGEGYRQMYIPLSSVRKVKA